MKYNIQFKGSYSILFVELDPGESVKAEPGATVSMRGDIEVKTRTGGFLKALKRTLFGGEHFFMNTYYANSKAEIAFAPNLPGDIEVVNVDGGILVQSTSYLVSDESIDIDTKFTGFKSFFAGEGFFLLYLKGYGKVALSSFGAIYKKTLESGEKLVVDTGHIVAFSENMNYNIRTFGGLKSTIFGGEGLICEFIGPGTVYIQTRNYPAFVEWIKSLLPKRETGSR